MVCPSGAICFAIPINHAQKRAWLPTQTTYRTQRRGILLERFFVQTYCTYGAQASSSSRSCTNLLLRWSRSTAPTGRHVYQKKPSQPLFPSSHRDDMFVKETSPLPFPPSCRDGMLVTKHKANPWFAPAGQYALPSQ